MSTSAQNMRQKDNNKNRKEKDGAVNKTHKAPFNKKKWREKQYSHKYKLQQWEDKRKKAILRKYYKELKKEKGLNVTKSIYDDEAPSTQPAAENKQKPKKLSSYKAAELKMQEIRKEKERQRQEKLKRKEEMKKALEEYKKKRTEKYKKLSRKTKNGQPLMRGRLEMLFEKIKQDIG